VPSASLTVQSLESLQRSIIADVTEAVQQGFRIRRRSGNTISTVSQISDATCNDIPDVADEAAKETIVRFSEDTKNESNETYSRGGGTARETFADVALNLGGYIGESASLNEDSNEN
jgi:prophage DNA circulation protein